VNPQRKSFVLLAILVGLIAACSGGGSVAAPGMPTIPPGGGAGSLPSGVPVVPGQPGQPAGSIDACALLTDEEIRAGAGHEVVERIQSTLTQVFPSVCDMQLDEGQLVVSAMASGGRALYERSFEPLIGEMYLEHAMTGLGDKAAHDGSGVLMVLSGDTLFDLQYIGSRPDKHNVVVYMAERILAKLPCLATGCPPIAVPPGPTIGPPTPVPTRPVGDPGSLPSTGAQARVVNLYQEDGEPVTVDVFAYAWSPEELREVGVLVATVPYGQASAWFNPGLVESAMGTATRVDMYRQGDSGRPLAAVTEFLGAGTVTTILLWQEEIFEGEPGAWAQTIYAEHPDYPIPEAPDGQGLLITRDVALREPDGAPILYASVGDGCLVHPLSDPSSPSPQPIANDLLIPAGDHTLTLHETPAGELATCTSKSVAAGAPISVAAGDRFLLFPYRISGSTDLQQLVLPFAP
jgi:hypothetical protein